MAESKGSGHAREVSHGLDFVLYPKSNGKPLNGFKRGEVIKLASATISLVAAWSINC